MHCPRPALRRYTPPGLDPRLAELMKQCWRRDPKERPTMLMLTDKLRLLLAELNRQAADEGTGSALPPTL